jgi:hypothetical protein
MALTQGSRPSGAPEDRSTLPVGKVAAMWPWMKVLRETNHFAVRFTSVARSVPFRNESPGLPPRFVVLSA